jgi:hypothetical protein
MREEASAHMTDKSIWCCDALRAAIPTDWDRAGPHYAYISPHRWARLLIPLLWYYKKANGPGWYLLYERNEGEGFQVIQKKLDHCPFCGSRLQPPV